MIPLLLLAALTPPANHAMAALPYVPTWQELVRTVESLRTRDGGLALLRANPKLAAHYSDDSTFTDLLEKWQGRLPALPANHDDLDPEQVTVQIRIINNTSALAYLTFHNDEPKGSLTFLQLTWEDKSLAKVEYFRGFVRQVPLPDYYQQDWYGSYRPKKR